MSTAINIPITIEPVTGHLMEADRPDFFIVQEASCELLTVRDAISAYRSAQARCSETEKAVRERFDQFVAKAQPNLIDGVGGDTTPSFFAFMESAPDLEAASAAHDQAENEMDVLINAFLLRTPENGKDILEMIEVLALDNRWESGSDDDVPIRFSYFTVAIMAFAKASAH